MRTEVVVDILLALLQLGQAPAHTASIKNVVFALQVLQSACRISTSEDFSPRKGYILNTLPCFRKYELRQRGGCVTLPKTTWHGGVAGGSASLVYLPTPAAKGVQRGCRTQKAEGCRGKARTVWPHAVGWVWVFSWTDTSVSLLLFCCFLKCMLFNVT